MPRPKCEVCGRGALRLPHARFPCETGQCRNRLAQYEAEMVAKGWCRAETVYGFVRSLPQHLWVNGPARVGWEMRDMGVEMLHYERCAVIIDAVWAPSWVVRVARFVGISPARRRRFILRCDEMGIPTTDEIMATSTVAMLAGDKAAANFLFGTRGSGR